MAQKKNGPGMRKKKSIIMKWWSTSREPQAALRCREKEMRLEREEMARL